MIERRKELELPDAVITMGNNFSGDLNMRLGRQLGDSAFRNLDDTWLFTRPYFEEQRCTLVVRTCAFTVVSDKPTVQRTGTGGSEVVR